jgi:mannose-6-phosphate isomerase-like protein (cupin superfamily)
MRHFVTIQSEAGFAAEKMQKNNLSGSDKVYYVIDGTARIRIGAEERDVGPGMAALAPSGVTHAVVNPGPSRLTVLVVMAPIP